LFTLKVIVDNIFASWLHVVEC